MTTQEQVTNFALRTDYWETPLGSYGFKGQAEEALRQTGRADEIDKITHRVETPLLADLIRVLNAHMKSKGLEPEEYGFAVSRSIQNLGAPVPIEYRWLIAFAVEGGSEGYYVHVGALSPTGQYQDFGFAKTYSPDSAYALATEAQRFLTAAQWN